MDMFDVCSVNYSNDLAEHHISDSWLSPITFVFIVHLSGIFFLHLFGCLKS